MQGDVCAPQIARTFLGRELQLTLGKWDMVWFSHLDDLAIGARSRPELKTSLEALAYRLKNHPAGPLELHDHSIRTAADGFEMIGYRVKLQKNNLVHVYATTKQCERLRERLRLRWENCEVFTKVELLEIGLKYAKNWYSSQVAWTKAIPLPIKSKFEGPSWECVVSEVHDCLNKFMANEYFDDIPWSSEEDIDFAALGYDEDGSGN